MKMNPMPTLLLVESLPSSRLLVPIISNFLKEKVSISIIDPLTIETKNISNISFDCFIVSGEAIEQGLDLISLKENYGKPYSKIFAISNDAETVKMLKQNVSVDYSIDRMDISPNPSKLVLLMFTSVWLPFGYVIKKIDNEEQLEIIYPDWYVEFKMSQLTFIEFKKISVKTTKDTLPKPCKDKLPFFVN